jgi:hypothetical protein
LEDLEVLDVGVFRVHVELDAAHGNVQVDAVKHLTQSSTVWPSASMPATFVGKGGESMSDDSPCAALFDLRDVELEQAVEPSNEFLSVYSVASAPVHLQN